MKKNFLLFPIFFGGILFAQMKPAIKKNDFVDDFKQISNEILVNGEAYGNLRELTKTIGHRFTGSANIDKAEKWAQKELKEAGAEKIWTMDVNVPNWERGNENFSVKDASGNWKNIRVSALGNSEGTGGKDLVADIIMVKSMDEFNKLSITETDGKIIFFNEPFDQSEISTTDAYAKVLKYRYGTASPSAVKGAKAVIIRSLTSANNDVIHYGNMVYENGDNKKIPILAISTNSADLIENLLNKGKVSGKLNTTSALKGEKINHSIIGEIPGNKDGKIILIAAHLDSWDTGEGASDDGTGIVQCLEVLRTFKKLGIKNNHTIRVVFFANEENGVKGGETYLNYIKKKNEPHIFAMESDEGGFTPRGISLEMIPQLNKQVQTWKNYFLPYGVYKFDDSGTGLDIAPLKTLKIPLAALAPDDQRYFDLHHSSEDTFEKVNRRELLLGATIMTQMVYMIDRNW